MTKKIVVATIIALMCVTWVGRAHADLLGSNYEITAFNGSDNQGGIFGGVFTAHGTLHNGSTVNFVDDYCVKLSQQIATNHNYQFFYNTSGNIDGHAVANAGEIAYLMVNYAGLADHNKDVNNNPGPHGKFGLQFALQSAVWKLADGINLSPSDPNYSEYLKYLAAGAGHSAPVSDLIWISPFKGSSTHPDYVQAQIALVPPNIDISHTPEPSSLGLLGLGGIGVAIAAYRRRRAA